MARYLPAPPLAVALAAVLAAGCASTPATTGSAGQHTHPAPAAAQGVNAIASGDDWPSYNRTLTSQRYAPQDQITAANAAGLRVQCTYDLGIDTSLQTGPILIGRTLYGTSEKETFAIDAATCAEHWRVKEEVIDSYLKTNRGLAYLDGRLFRGLQDWRSRAAARGMPEGPRRP